VKNPFGDKKKKPNSHRSLLGDSKKNWGGRVNREINIAKGLNDGKKQNSREDVAHGVFGDPPGGFSKKENTWQFSVKRKKKKKSKAWRGGEEGKEINGNGDLLKGRERGKGRELRPLLTVQTCLKAVQFSVWLNPVTEIRRFHQRRN